MKRPIALAFSLGALSLPLAGAAQDTGLYTAAQAEQGAALYAAQCVACHGTQLDGGLGPPLTGHAFHEMAATQHLSGEALLDRISRTMPMTAPSKLKPEEYANLVAFILQRSGYPAGSQPLKADSTALTALDLGIDKSAPPGAAAAAGRTASQGVYTSTQMEQGKNFYGENCVQCHGAELEGAEDAPPLAGKAFLAKWGGLPLGSLHAFIDKNMPPGNGGAMGPDNETQIVAFILSKNRFPAGAEPLKSDPAFLNAIAIK